MREREREVGQTDRQKESESTFKNSHLKTKPANTHNNEKVHGNFKTTTQIREHDIIYCTETVPNNKCKLPFTGICHHVPLCSLFTFRNTRKIQTVAK